MELHSRDTQGRELHLRSRSPSMFSGTAEEVAMSGFFGGESGAAAFAGTLSSAGLALLFLSLLYALVRFISRRLFLIDLLEPLWSAPGGALGPIVGRNLFLVGQRQIPAAEAEAKGLVHLHLGEIAPEIMAGGEAWTERRRQLVESGVGVLVAGFEHRITDPRFNG